jgi:hypothetical protein
MPAMFPGSASIAEVLEMIVGELGQGAVGYHAAKIHLCWSALRPSRIRSIADKAEIASPA